MHSIHLTLGSDEVYPLSAVSSPNGFTVTYSNGDTVEYGFYRISYTDATAVNCNGELTYMGTAPASVSVVSYRYTYTENDVTTSEFTLFEQNT